MFHVSVAETLNVHLSAKINAVVAVSLSLYVLVYSFVFMCLFLPLLLLLLYHHQKTAIVCDLVCTNA